MTPAEKAEYRDKVGTCLSRYLSDNRLLHSDPSIIMNHLTPMYKKLESEGLVHYGLTYEFFVRQAQEAFIFSQLNGGRK